MPDSYSTSENIYHSYDSSKLSSTYAGQRLDIFDDEIYSSGTYVPPQEQFSTLKRLSSKRSSGLKKRTDSTNSLLGDLEGDVVADEPHELLAESSLNTSHGNGPPPVPPKSIQPKNL